MLKLYKSHKILINLGGFRLIKLGKNSNKQGKTGII